MPRETDSRSETRSNVFLSASLATNSSTLPVRIRNLSPHGALLDGHLLPAAGSSVRLVRGGLTVSGQVAWQADDWAGIGFDQQIDIDQWVRRVGHAGQQRVDSVVAALRRKETPLESRGAAIPPSLAAITSELDQICARLAATPEMSVEVAEDPLRLDAVAQALRQIGRHGDS